MDLFKPKRGSHSVIRNINPMLEEGELVFEYADSGERIGLIKLGDGIHRYNDLPAFLYTITDYISIEEKGAANGVAPLNEQKKVPGEYLPSYVDDIIEYPTRQDFPVPGEKGKLYVDISATWNNIYRWSGTIYVCIGTSVRYNLTQNGNKVSLRGTDDSVNTVDVTQIFEYEDKVHFPNPGKAGAIYVDLSGITNNTYRWDEPTSEYVQVAQANTYSLEKVGPHIILHSSDESDSIINSPIQEFAKTDDFPTIGEANTFYVDLSTTENNVYRWDTTTSSYKVVSTSVTYSISKLANKLKFTGSDGSEIDLDNDVVFYDTKSDFPTGDQITAGNAGNRLYVDLSAKDNNVYRWDSTNSTYVLVAGNTTYRLTRDGNNVKLYKTFDGTETLVNSINTGISFYAGKSNFPTTGEVNILYVDKSQEVNNLYKWDTTDYKVISGNDAYSLTKGTNELKLNKAVNGSLTSTVVSTLVRDVMVYANKSSFPTTGEDGVVYMDKSNTTNNFYRWDGTKYVSVAADSSYTLAKNGKKYDFKEYVAGVLNATTQLDVPVQGYTTSSLFPTTGAIDILYVDRSALIENNNLYRWDTTDKKYKHVAGDTTYAMSTTTTSNVNYLEFDEYRPVAGSVSSKFIPRSVQLFSNKASFPTTGYDGIIYVDLAQDYAYRWNGTQYAKILNGTGLDSYTLSKSGDTISLIGKFGDGNTTNNITEVRYSIARSSTGLVTLTGKTGTTTTNTSSFTDANTTYALSNNGSTIKLTGSDGASTSITQLTYTVTTSGSSLVLKGSVAGYDSTVSNVGGVEIRSTDPSAAELYPGKMWIKV